MKDPGLLRTQFAVRQQDLAATFNAAMSKTRLAPADYAPELTAPEGPSTGGGAQALQRLRLVAKVQGYPALVVGTINQNAGTAELRGYDYVDAVHRERFKRAAGLDRGQYDAFLGMAQNFFGVMRLNVTIVNGAPPPESPAGAPTPSAGGANYVVVVVIVIALVVVVAAAAAGYWFLRLRH